MGGAAKKFVLVENQKGGASTIFIRRETKTKCQSPKCPHFTMLNIIVECPGG